MNMCNVPIISQAPYLSTSFWNKSGNYLKESNE